MRKHVEVFSVLHGEIAFTPEQLEYYDIRYRFRMLAEKSRQLALDEFRGIFKSFADMVNGADNWVNEYLVQGATLASKILAENEHYDLAPAQFVKEWFDMSRLDAAVSYLKAFEQKPAQQASSPAQGEGSEEELDASDSAEEENDEAEKTAEAEGMNPTDTALSGAFGQILRSCAGKRQKSELDQFLADKKTSQVFADGIYGSLANMYLDLFKYIDKKCPEINIVCLKDEDVAKAELLLSNVMKGIIPQEKIEEQCRRILSLNPLFVNAYAYIMEKYPDEIAPVVKVADFFKISEVKDMLSRKLDEFYKTLCVDTENDVWESQKKMAEYAKKIGIEDYKGYPELDKLAAEFDRIARTVGPREFETREEAQRQRQAYELYRSSGFTGSEEKAQTVKRQLEDLSKRESIDVSWLMEDVDKALKHYDELARTTFEYMFKTREDCRRASADEALFFLAVWSRISRYVKKNGIKAFAGYSASVQSTARKTLNLEDDTPVFAYLNTEMISSGNSGLVFTPKGISWSNGSALMTKLATNKLFKALFSKKAGELEEKNKIQAYFVSWKAFLNSKVPLAGSKSDVIQLDQDLTFEASHLNAGKLKEMLTQVREWAQSTSIEFTDGDKPFVLDDLQVDVQTTPLPELK